MTGWGAICPCDTRAEPSCDKFVNARVNRAWARGFSRSLTRSTRRRRRCRCSSATTTPGGVTRACSPCSTRSRSAACRSTSPSSRPSWTPASRASCVQRPVGLHQHGLAHVNHEREGRKCEFGPSRDAAAQRRDIADGRERLAALLGDRVDPIFTPPWNRCTADTGAVLAELGFAAAVAGGAGGSAGRAGPARAAGQRRLVRPPRWRAAEPVRARRADRRGDRRGLAGRADVPSRGHGCRGHACGPPTS